MEVNVAEHASLLSVNQVERLYFIYLKINSILNILSCKKLECADLLEVTCWSPSHLPCYNQVG